MSHIDQINPFNIIPAIDILEGQVVRLTQGDYDQVTYYEMSPVDCAKKYVDCGASRIHLVDLNGAKEGILINQKVFEDIRQAVDCELELGGGIRNSDSAKQLFDIGINFLILGSVLAKDFKSALTIIRKFPNKIIAGIDTKNGHIVVEGWLEKSPVSTESLILALNEEPVFELICTDVDKDGMMEGPNVPALLRIAALSKHNVIASGGISSLDDIRLLKAYRNDGISGCITGKAVLQGAIDLASLWKN